MFIEAAVHPESCDSRHDCVRNSGRGRMHEMKLPLPHLPQSSVQKGEGEGVFSGVYGNTNGMYNTIDRNTNNE